ncbi:MAG: EAL domain-containing protein [Stigonema ocellatum SAG 48.90 = DSM 106950]|nr:EAL domain-containing protein [Stigonema ocellatum SAG 48.90 = DSM 106950]
MIRPLEGYQRKELFHEDSNTVIYRGVRELNQMPVLMKFIKTEYPSLEDIARLKYEHQILQSLDIPGVIKSYALEDLHQFWVLVLEDFGGEPLSTFLNLHSGGGSKKKSLELNKFLHIAIHLAETLAQLHLTHKVIHKNLKTANVLLNPLTGQVKLADFSVATRLSRENQTISSPNLLEGTLAYMSPEQTGRMNRLIDYRTDFYSLGIVFYEILTGELPFQAIEPLEIVHCHIAKSPISVRITAQNLGLREIPQAVCDIVMKLLAKTAEDRYQNALGLKADLETCLRLLETTGEVTPFPVGQVDLYSQFLIPQKLYGRESEVAILMAAFERVSQGTTEMMLVSGYSGVGKSSLVFEVHKPIIRQRGYFIFGKFDQFKRNIPYAALIEAFQELMRQLLTESAERIAIWQAKLKEALSPNGQVIVDVIPEVERIIGSQPVVPQLGASEAQNRFNRVFGQFIHVFCKSEHPLVLFLDDLQWADSASLKLIYLLMNDPNSQYLLLIGAYRDHEVSTTHPLILTLSEIQAMGAAINNMVLEPLHLSHVSQLIIDTFHTNQHRSHLLAELVFRKTQGNPFFLSQLLKSLYQDNLLCFDFQDGCWRWDIEMLQGIDITDNVVELMVSQIQKLLPATQNVLKLAACIGNKFTLKILSIVNEKSLSQTALNLWEALQVGLVLPLNQSYKIPLVLDLEKLETEQYSQPKIIYKFLHDRVQQATYSLIPEASRRQTHLRIGELLLEHTPETELEENLFEIVNHLNIGAFLLTQQKQKDELATLNLQAGQKAKKATAYEYALKYLTSGLLLLSKTSWKTNYDLSLALYVEAISVEFLNNNFERSAMLANVVLKHALNILDKVKVYEIQIQFCISQNKLKEAIAIDLQVLEMLGIPLSQKLPKALVRQYKDSLRIEHLSSLPPMTDPYKIAGMRILIAAGPPTYFADPQLFASVIFTMVDLCLEYGNSAMAAYGYACYGLILAGELNEIDAGYQSCLFALSLIEKYDAKELKAEIYEIFNGHVRHFQEHLNASLEPMLEGITSGLEVGNIQYASYIAAFYSANLFYTGKNLESVAEKFDQRLELLNSLRNQICIDYAKIWRQMVANLMGESRSKFELNGEHFNETEMAVTLTTVGNQAALSSLYLAKTNLLYLYKEYAQAIENAEIAERYIGSVTGTINVCEHSFYYMLALLGQYPHATVEEQRQYLQTVELRQQQMAKLALAAPMNFLHKYDLVEAEKAKVLGQHDQAMEYYDRAIQNARKQGYLQEEALAAELAAEFYFARGRERVARDYLTDAYYGYLHWGATAKVQDLLERYPQVFSGGQAQPKMGITPTYTTALDSTSLDLTTIIKASQALSDEIVLAKLLDKLMNSLMENAGARTGLLLLQQEGQWVLMAEGFADKDNAIVLPPRPMATNSNLPVALINYVARSESTVVLDDATVEGSFTNDTYILDNRPKSVLCLPIIYQSQMKGILYLENNLTKGAFTRNHVEVLNLLASQAAISLENAGLYQELQTYAQKVENKNVELSQINASLANEISDRQRREVERQRDEEVLRESSTRLRFVLDSAQFGDWDLDLLNESHTAHRSIKHDQIFGYESLLPKWNYEMFLEHVLPEDRAVVDAKFRTALANGDLWDIECRIRRADGELRWIWVRGHIYHNSQGDAAQMIGLVADISARKQAEEVIFREKELAQVTLQSIGDAVITTDALGYVQYLNPIAQMLTGWSQLEAKGLPLCEVFQIINETTREPVLNPVEHALREGRIVGLANYTILISRNGEEFAIDDSAAPIHASDGQVIGAVMVFHDVSDTRSLSRQLSWQASHDALTGLLNRRKFEYHLEQTINHAKTHNQQHALCYLDLDQFKIVNDTCGHFAGDELLRQVTRLFQSQVRKTDTLARLGGDEFGLLLNQCSLEYAQRIANDIREKVQEFRFIWEDKVFTIGVSIGLVIIDNKAENIAKILSFADAACYAAKNRGRNRVHIYQVDDLDLAQQQGEMQWVTRLGHALEENRFRLYYQPIVPVLGSELNTEHYEVLLRLQDETGSLVSPMAFIPAAERYNLMHLIDRWVIRTLFATQGQHYCDTWNRCQDQNCQYSYLYAINISGASINDEQFIEFLHEQFALHQIPPQMICFEITETIAIANLSKASQFISELKSLGCSFALDDFGSGMSSFTYLKNLPIDFIKIDGSFIKQILDNPIDSAVVEAINHIGQVMGLKTIAEFVENDAILEKIKALGVNYAQGYGIAPPRPFEHTPSG